MHRTRNAAYGQPYRGFESLPLRQNLQKPPTKLAEWAKELSPKELEHPSFRAFKTWLEKKRYSHYLDFRSTEGPHRAAEWWFDQEFKQTWRN